MLVRSVERSWIRIFLNSVSNAENTFVLISRGKKTPVQNLTPVKLGIIIVLLVWMICFFVRVVVTIGQERDAGPSKIISVTNVKGRFKFESRNPRLPKNLFGGQAKFETISNEQILNVRNKKGLRNLYFENSDLFRASIFEFRIFIEERYGKSS